jgi:hypothetical protein
LAQPFNLKDRVARQGSEFQHMHGQSEGAPAAISESPTERHWSGDRLETVAMAQRIRQIILKILRHLIFKMTIDAQRQRRKTLAAAFRLRILSVGL